MANNWFVDTLNLEMNVNLNLKIIFPPELKEKERLYSYEDESLLGYSAM
jgi:hypothetical protein